MKPQSKKLAVLAAKAADSKKAKNISVLDLAGKSSLADLMIIASVESYPQMKAVEEEITKVLKAGGTCKLHADGAQSGTWRVLDYGGIIIHLFNSDTRDFYALDRLYYWALPVLWKRRKKKK